MLSDVTFEWCSNPDCADDLARFFVENTDANYISHTELQIGRALDEDRWAGNILEVVKTELRLILDGTSIGRKILVARRLGTLAALAVLNINSDSQPPFAVLEDLVVARAERGTGIGTEALQLIETECRRAGCSRIFLESGSRNRGAHAFFERAGFHPCSVVMMKKI